MQNVVILNTWRAFYAIITSKGYSKGIIRKNFTGSTNGKPQHCSTNSFLLKNALNITDERIIKRKSVLKEIDKFDIKNVNKFPDPAKLTREDRDR
jgi:hypothetical protein